MTATHIIVVLPKARLSTRLPFSTGVLAYTFSSPKHGLSATDNLGSNSEASNWVLRELTWDEIKLKSLSPEITSVFLLK